MPCYQKTVNLAFKDVLTVIDSAVPITLTPREKGLQAAAGWESAEYSKPKATHFVCNFPFCFSLFVPVINGGIVFERDFCVFLFVIDLNLGSRDHLLCMKGQNYITGALT